AGAPQPSGDRRLGLGKPARGSRQRPTCPVTGYSADAGRFAGQQVGLLRLPPPRPPLTRGVSRTEGANGAGNATSQRVSADAGRGPCPRLPETGPCVIRRSPLTNRR